MHHEWTKATTVNHYNLIYVNLFCSFSLGPIFLRKRIFQVAALNVSVYQNSSFLYFIEYYFRGYKIKIEQQISLLNENWKCKRNYLQNFCVCVSKKKLLNLTVDKLNLIAEKKR